MWMHSNFILVVRVREEMFFPNLLLLVQLKGLWQACFSLFLTFVYLIKKPSLLMPYEFKTLKNCMPTGAIGFPTPTSSFFGSHRRRNCWNARHVSTWRVWPGWLCCWCSGARADAAPAGENCWWRCGYWSSFFWGSQQWVQPCKEDCGKVIIRFLFSSWCLRWSDIRYHL